MRSFPFLALVLLAAPACKHDDGEAVGTATIRSGTPDGPRVTDVRAMTSDDLATQLTSTICSRERQCARQRGRGEQGTSCEAEIASTSTLTVQSLACDATAARPGFEACLAAIRAEGCDTSSGFSADLPACRIAQICAPSR